jgi:hypothetical protein
VGVGVWLGAVVGAGVSVGRGVGEGVLVGGTTGAQFNWIIAPPRFS